MDLFSSSGLHALNLSPVLFYRCSSSALTLRRRLSIGKWIGDKPMFPLWFSLDNLFQAWWTKIEVESKGALWLCLRRLKSGIVLFRQHFISGFQGFYSNPIVYPTVYPIVLVPLCTSQHISECGFSLSLNLGKMYGPESHQEQTCKSWHVT